MCVTADLALDEIRLLRDQVNALRGRLYLLEVTAELNGRCSVTDPVVPPPQEELRRVVFSALHIHSWDPIEKIADKVTDAFLPLFAARVAAIEAAAEKWAGVAGEQSGLRIKAEAELAALRERVAELTANLEAAGDELQAAWRATGEVAERVAAERTQAAAQAWDEGYDAPREKRWLGPSGSNAYREAKP